MIKFLCAILALILLLGGGALSEGVVALSGSLAEIWLLAGGTLAGVTDDAAEEHGLDVGGAASVGSLKNPSAEAAAAMRPDLVIYSPDIDKQNALADMLQGMGIAAYAAKVDSFEDYLRVLGDFCAMTGREDLYAQNGLDVAAEMENLQSRVPDSPVTALVLRAYSSGVKVKASGTVLCDMLDSAGVTNIAASDSPLEDMGLEAIIAADPDFIFIVTMGADSEAALNALNTDYLSNPAWKTLTGRQITLPRELFHYKPNARWAEAYKYLLKIIWPEIFGGEATPAD